MLKGWATRLATSGLRALACVLLASACSAQNAPTPAPDAPQPSIRTEAEKRELSRMRLTPEEVRALREKAKAGNIEAIYGLVAHHSTGSEPEEARYWLGEAVKLGDCHAVQILENTYLRIPPDELAHWRSEGRRLGCDPNKDYSKAFDNN